MQKKGDPSITLGQGALGGLSNLDQRKLGGLSNLDQRKLNIMYCESAKPNLVKTKLTKILSYTIREDKGVSSKVYTAALTTKLGKIYALFQFSITVFDDKTA